MESEKGNDEHTVNLSLLQTLDTTIILQQFNVSNYKGKPLTDTLAKTILYRHFTNKGYYNSDNLPALETLSDEDGDKLSVDYNSIYIADFNNNTYRDAIVTYWVTPPYASGHCWQPHKALIVDTDNGYKSSMKNLSLQIILSIVLKNSRTK